MCTRELSSYKRIGLLLAVVNTINMYEHVHACMYIIHIKIHTLGKYIYTYV